MVWNIWTKTIIKETSTRIHPLLRHNYQRNFKDNAEKSDDLVNLEKFLNFALVDGDSVIIALKTL